MAPFFITRYFIDLGNMRFTHYFNTYTEVLHLIDEATRCYKIIEQDFEHEVCIISNRQVLEYKVTIKLLS
jgi:hypothetical protein